MTLSESIYIADDVRRNTIKEKTKRKWIEEIDQLIWREVISTHEGDIPAIPIYGIEDDETVLLAPDPYSALYPRYIIMKIDESTQELGKFNNSSAIFNNYYGEFTAWYNRTHMPLGETKVKI